MQSRCETQGIEICIGSILRCSRFKMICSYIHSHHDALKVCSTHALDLTQCSSTWFNMLAAFICFVCLLLFSVGQRTWFFLDFITLIPFELLTIGSGSAAFEDTRQPIDPTFNCHFHCFWKPKRLRGFQLFFWRKLRSNIEMLRSSKSS